MSMIMLPGLVKAAEGGSGLYILGSQGPLAGYMPPPGFYLRHDDYFYHGNASVVPLGGNVNLNAKARFFLDFTTLTLVTPYKIFNGDYGFGAVFPVGTVTVKATADILEPINLNASRQKTDSGYADMIVYPAILGWHLDSLHIVTSLGVFIPTGSYKRGRIANIGKNHYALDPGVGVTWLDADYGLEISSWIGYTINFENKKIHYRTGGEFHAEFFLGKNLGKSLQIGLVNYMYNQLTADSGRGALLGPFKGHVIGLGPSVFYNFELKGTPISLNARYYKEFDVRHRLKGEAAFITLKMPIFSAPKK
jgi:hypothetical protein